MQDWENILQILAIRKPALKQDQPWKLHKLALSAMLRVVQIAVFISFGWFILSANASGLDHTEQFKVYQQNSQKASAEQRGYRAYPDKYADSCYESSDHDTADLCAQWRAAIAAEKAADATIFSTFLAFISTVLILLTLAVTRKQIKDAETDRNTARAEAASLARDTASALAQSTRSATAAIAAADYAKQSLSTDRAWICSAGIQHGYSFAGHLDGKPIGDGFVFISQWTNSGRTPATSAIMFCQNVILEPDDPIPPFVVDYERNDSVSCVIGPGMIVSGPHIALDAESSILFQQRKKKIAIWSRVEYRDIFNPDVIRVSEVCIIARHMGGTKTENGRTQHQITFGAEGPQNSVS